MKKTRLLIILVMMLPLFLFSQKTIKGTVTDQSLLPLPGATILIEDSDQGTVTDFDGNFELIISAESTNLIVSYTGYLTKTVEIGDQLNFSIQLEESVEALSEVVVTALGFKENKDQMGSTSSVVSVESVNRAGEATLINSLSGKASSVQIIRPNGDPGAGSSIKIRGANTIDGSSQPLIIVDGVPLNNSTNYGGGGLLIRGRRGGVTQGSRLNDINPSDIESTQVLKGASAAALWGSRAANGVIVITTKSGSSGEAKISFKSSYSFDEVSEKIPLQSIFGQGRNGVYSPTSAESWGDIIADRPGGSDVFDESGQRFVAANGNIYYPILQKNSRETFIDKNWDSVFQTGHFSQNDLTISGGNDQNTYFFSLGNLSQEGIVKKSTYNRTNLRFNYDAKLNDWLKLSNKVSYTYTNSNRIQQSQNVSGLMLGLTRTPADFDNSDYKGTYYDASGVATENRHRSFRRYLGNNINPIYNNPLWTVNEQKMLTDVNRFTATPQFTATPNSWLQLISRFNTDVASDKRTYFFPVSSAGEVQTGVYNEDVISNRVLNFDFLGKANINLSSDINLTATAGWSYSDRKYQRNTGRITGFLVNSTKQTTSLNTAAEASILQIAKLNRRYNRGYAVLNFDFYDSVFLNVSGALENSSTINGSFFYPSTDVAWNFQKSNSESAFSFGKLRASWGKVGVQPSAHRFQTLAEGSFSYSTLNNPLDIDLFGGGYRVDNNLGNPDLKPEIKTEWEIGADLRFLENKLSLSLTYYKNDIDGILLNVDLAPSSGYSTKYGNFGSMENKGFEVDMSFDLINKQDLSLDASLNWSTNDNVVTNLAGTESIYLGGGNVYSAAVVGHPLGVIYGRGSQVDDNGDFILNNNGFPILTNGLVVLGDPNPDWRGGITLNFSYKKLRLSTVIEHSSGGEFNPRTLHVLNRWGMTMETANMVTLDQNLVNYSGSVVPMGSTVRGNIKNFGAGPVLLDETWYRTGIGGGLGDNQAYNFNIYDATFTKVRELSLSYLIDSSTLGASSFVDNIEVTVTGRNLLNFNRVPGIDPEINQNGVGNAMGVEYFTNPQTKSILTSVKFNF